MHYVLAQGGKVPKQHARQSATVHAACNFSSLPPFRLDELNRLYRIATPAVCVGSQIENDKRQFIYTADQEHVPLTWHRICFHDYTLFNDQACMQRSE